METSSGLSNASFTQRISLVIRALGPIDLRTIRRDSFLLWMVPLPLGIIAAIGTGVAPLTEWLSASYEFDLTPYHPLVVAYIAFFFAPLLVGQISGFLLLDERDADTLTALRATPLPLTAYFAYRVGVPLLLCLLTTLFALVLFPIVELQWSRVLPIAIVAALEAPIVALLVGSYPRDKVQGFAFVKTLGSFQLIPIVAVFVPVAVQVLLALHPGTWILKAFLASDGLHFAIWLAGALLLHVAYLWLLVRRFRYRLER
jgi:fluoroquinolone transport system permease protein